MGNRPPFNRPNNMNQLNFDPTNMMKMGGHPMMNPLQFQQMMMMQQFQRQQQMQRMTTHQQAAMAAAAQAAAQQAQAHQQGGAGQGGNTIPPESQKPPTGYTCFKCGQPGHWIYYCPNVPKGQFVQRQPGGSASQYQNNNANR
jgi:hypothetical protein